MTDDAPQSPCPDDAEIADFVHGGLAAPRQREVELHLDGCSACTTVVSELVRIYTQVSDKSEAAPARAARLPSQDGALPSTELAVTLGASMSAPGGPRTMGATLKAGDEVGRYRVLECVGVGGMGVVYSAYDPELDRRVALKLLRRTSDGSGSRSRSGRLLREAQAMAKLSHPNVITVHDVGTWNEHVFVAMEFVHGGTLDAWMKEGPRTWAEVRDVFVAAGRGLAAAHAVGMVHRDFKPENVLLGASGRVRVTDFGLARQADTNSSDMISVDEPDSESIPNLDSISQARTPLVSLTETGALVGTPAYMAPEQYEQRPADAASDQFAFCVALYEAIYGERPFAGRTVAELASNVLEGSIIDATKGVVVPRAVRAAVRRGLSRRAADRFGSMEELLAVIDRRPARRWWLAASIGVPVVAVGGALLAYGTAEPVRAPFCADDGGLAALWSPARRADMQARFLATELEFAADSADRFVDAVDEYADGWESLRARSCGPAASEEGAGIIALRERCLGRRRVALEALLEVYEEVDAGMVARAVGAVGGLPPLDNCGDAESLMAELPPPVPLDVRTEVEEVRDELARASGLVPAGRYDEGLALARRLDARATEIGHLPLQAETTLMLGRLLDRTGKPEQANETFERALLLAMQSRHRRIAAEAMIHQVFVLGVMLPQMDRAQRVAARALAEIEAVGMGPEARAPLLLNRASVAYRQGDIARAIELGKQSMEIRDREAAPLRWADAAFNVATFQMVMGEADDAAAQFEEHVRIYEDELGPMHPEVASGLQNLGVAYFNAGRLPEADKALTRALEIRRVTIGEDHLEFARTLNMLGSVRLGQDEPEQALEFIERGIRSLEASGIAPLDIASNRVDRASALLALDRVDEAEREIGGVLDLMVPALGEDHHQLGAAHHVAAEVAAAQGDIETMRQQFARARAIWTKISGPDHSDVLRIGVDEAVLLSEHGHADEAEASLRELLAEHGAEQENYAVSHAHLTYAGLLWRDPERRGLARTHAQRARDAFASQSLSEPLREAEQWLAEHPAP